MYVKILQGFLRKVFVSAGTASALIGFKLKLYCMRKIEILEISLTIKIMIIIADIA
tara:strand:- start:431 stop:598 length:168 start_codon:yes stop_codon:yes gene_type:complete